MDKQGDQAWHRYSKKRENDSPARSIIERDGLFEVIDFPHRAFNVRMPAAVDRYVAAPGTSSGTTAVSGLTD